jgi:hypothetical protein
MVDERHDDARGHGSCGLGREMPVRAARPQRIGGHEQQHASMRNRLPSLRLVPAGNTGSLRRLSGRKAERFRMGPAVVVGQDLTKPQSTA